MDFTFGKTRRQKCLPDPETSDTKCTIKAFTVLRNRFDFNFETGVSRRLAIMFMHEFIKYMQSIEKVNMYPHFNISYHTSHTLQDEIVKYSTYDLKYVGFMFLAFWCVYILLMWFDLALLKMLVFTRSHTLANFFNKLNWFFINNSGLLILATLVQYFGTIIATLGLMSLFGVAVNQMLYTILFVLMIINCHQSLLLYRMIRNIDKWSKSSDLGGGIKTALPSTADMRNMGNDEREDNADDNDDDDDEDNEREDIYNNEVEAARKREKIRRQQRLSQSERAASDEIISLNVVKEQNSLSSSSSNGPPPLVPPRNIRSSSPNNTNLAAANGLLPHHRQHDNRGNNEIAMDPILVDVKLEYNDKLNEFTHEYKEKLTKAIQQILVPCFCTLMMTIFAYLLIGLTTGFDAIRIYSFFLGKLN
jgi:hypothetical protein